jgi:hypothetical protein
MFRSFVTVMFEMNTVMSEEAEKFLGRAKSGRKTQKSVCLLVNNNSSTVWSQRGEKKERDGTLVLCNFHRLNC